MAFFTYIIFSDSLKQYYTGSTNDLNKRISDHNKGWSRHTSKGVPWTLVYSIIFETRSEALHKENSIKKRGAKRFLEGIV